MTTRLPIPKERLEQILAHCKRETPENMAPISARSAVEIIGALLAAHEQEPVAVVELSDYVTAAQLSGDEPRRKAVKELYEALVVGQNLYASPAPVPAVPDVGEFRIFTQVGGVKVATKDGKTKNHLFGMGWNACRAAMLNGGKS